MKLQNKYAIGTHVMFYEIEMYPDFINGLINLLEAVENKENVYLDFCFNTSEYFEKIDKNKISLDNLFIKFNSGIEKLKALGYNNIKTDIKNINDEIYNIADYRRDFNNNYCKKVDFLMWGETDSFFPKESFKVLESLKNYTDKNNFHRYILSWSERKMWDESWKVTEHVDYENIIFVDTPDQVDNENYAKSPLSIEKMNLINSKTVDIDIRVTNEPKIDGSCLVISSDLIKCGVNIPHSLLCSGDDSSLGVIAKQLLGDKFIQIVVKNILKVHARRHPKKRMYILNENNPRGFCGKEKGDWWKILQDYSKSNLNILLNNQNKFYTFDDVFDKIKNI
jgi:hypothetical protein